MKLHTLIPTLAVAGLIAVPALSQEKKKEAAAAAVEVDPFALPEARHAALPKLIQVQVEWIEMSHEALTHLMYLRDPKGDSTELRKEVQDFVMNGSAKIVETSIVLARPGQKATSEAVREHIYPTEYEPSEIPSEVRIDATVDDKALSQLRTPPTPTAFETRNVGTTLEIEPNIGADGKTLDLRMNPEIVIDTGEAVWQTLKDSLGNENTVRMPLYYSSRVSSGLTMLDGQYRLAAVQSPPGEDGEVDRSQKIMIFVKCDVIAIGEETLPKAKGKGKARK